MRRPPSSFQACPVDFAINRTTAKILGIGIPNTLLAVAGQVID
jgi:hypothetical protein